ncbi:MAG: TlpA family protein disulfide reductase [Campylobacteraceae bacterium]|jgi:thiol-disulfide isomerase/thioredoxin|nr:TlpA family protein disulfide reductase [Campylobacteraceae bacterium]
MNKIALFALSALLLCSCSNIGEKNHIVLNDTSPLKTTFSPSNKTLSLNNKRAFMLFFFSTDCGACKEAIPSINFFAQKYSGSFDIVGIMNGSMGFDSDMELLKAQNITFKVISESKSVEYLSHAVGGVYGVPVIYMYDKDGKVASRFLGLTPQNKLEEEIRKLI